MDTAGGMKRGERRGRAGGAHLTAHPCLCSCPAPRTLPPALFPWVAPSTSTFPKYSSFLLQFPKPMKILCSHCPKSNRSRNGKMNKRQKPRQPGPGSSSRPASLRASCTCAPSPSTWAPVRAPALSPGSERPSPASYGDLVSTPSTLRFSPASTLVRQVMP